MTDAPPPRRQSAPVEPDAASLRDAAIAHLARYATTQAGLRRVLLRRIDRWARALPDPAAEQDRITAVRALVPVVIAGLVAAGALDDAAFAERRGLGLLRAGRSRRAAIARLQAQGIPAGQATAALATGDDTAELAAALVLMRRRRIGAFAPDAAASPEAHGKALAILARAGFPAAIARAALATSRDEAEARIRALRAAP